MNFIPTPRWIVHERFSNPKIHGILHDVVQVLKWHPWHVLVEECRHHGKKIHTTASRVIINCITSYCLWFLVVLKGGGKFVHIPKEECLKELIVWLQKFIPPPTCFLAGWIV
jgi:hypothetical protein